MFPSTNIVIVYLNCTWSKNYGYYELSGCYKDCDATSNLKLNVTSAFNVSISATLRKYFG